MTRVRITPEYPGLVISDDGRIQGPSGKWLKPVIDQDGYHRVSVKINGKWYPRGIHAIVCAAFHGPAPTPEHHAAHRNDVKSDNRAENIRWATPAENNGSDRNRNGHTARGEISGNAKLTEEIVKKIRIEHAAGVSISELSRTYGVARSTICRIYARKTWGHVS